MKDSVFRFKRFSVHNERSGLKVGTDGVLLGAACTLPPYGPACHKTAAPPSAKPSDIRILDVGTGTGLIALMAAQRMAERRQYVQGLEMPEVEMHGMETPGTEMAGVKIPGMEMALLENPRMEIVGVEIDREAAEEAGRNFAESPWTDSLRAVNIPLQAFENGLWDLIVSNPPFFENSLRAPLQSRSNARHTDTLSYREIIAFASRSLNENGIVSMILPASGETNVLRYAASFGLHATRILSIRTTAAKAPKRIIVELGRRRGAALCGAVSAPKAETAATQPLREELTMMSDGAYTPAFRALVGEFYLNV